MLANLVFVSSVGDFNDIILLFCDLNVDLHVSVGSASQVAVFIIVVVVAARARVSLQAINLVVVVFIPVEVLAIVGHSCVHGSAIHHWVHQGQTVLAV